MNKPKYQVTLRVQKKMNKEVRSAKPTPAPAPAPVKKAAAPSKKSGARSKRTTPGEIAGRDAAPKIVHTENVRWIKASESKIQATRKVTTRHNLKKPNSKKPNLKKKGR